MDPDLVRQQAEEEAASRTLSRRDLPPDVRVEPVLPMGRVRAFGGADSRAPDPHAGAAEVAAVVASAGWRTALGIATSCVLGVTVGLVGGLMLGVKLQLVPSQGAVIGAAAGFLIAWQIGAAGLRRRATLSRWRAQGAGFRAAFLILVIMAAAMFVAPHYIGAAAAPNGPFEIGLFWKSVAAGAMIALLLGGVVVRGALRHAVDARRA
jgi:hypothetical protein